MLLDNNLTQDQDFYWNPMMKRTIKELSRQRSITTMDHMHFSICTTCDGTNFLNFTAHNPIPVKTRLEISRCSWLLWRKSCFGPVSTLSMTASQWQVSTKQKEAIFFSESGCLAKQLQTIQQKSWFKCQSSFQFTTRTLFCGGWPWAPSFCWKKMKEKKELCSLKQDWESGCGRYSFVNVYRANSTSNSSKWCRSMALWYKFSSALRPTRANLTDRRSKGTPCASLWWISRATVLRP